MIQFYIKKCRVQVNFSCFALLAFCCIFSGMGSGAACFFAILLHESAHLAVMWLNGAPATQIRLSALGCRITADKGKVLTDVQNIAVSLAGPIMNWLCYFMVLGLGQGECALALANLALGFVHSLPIEPLDGGLAMRYFLSKEYGALQAGKINRAISFFFLFPLATLGFLIVIRSYYNYSLLALSMYLMLYLLLGWDYSEP